MERLKSHRDFVAVLKRRRKVSTRDLVLHYRLQDLSSGLSSPADYQREVADPSPKGFNGSSDQPIYLGLAVSKAVGHAVERNKVKRRFRVLARKYELLLAQALKDRPGTRLSLVMRAKPQTAHVPFADLDQQVEKAFVKLVQQMNGSDGRP